MEVEKLELFVNSVRLNPHADVIRSGQGSVFFGYDVKTNTQVVVKKIDIGEFCQPMIKELKFLLFVMEFVSEEDDKNSRSNNKSI